MVRAAADLQLTSHDWHTQPALPRRLGDRLHVLTCSDWLTFQTKSRGWQLALLMLTSVSMAIRDVFHFSMKKKNNGVYSIFLGHSIQDAQSQFYTKINVWS